MLDLEDPFGFDTAVPVRDYGALSLALYIMIVHASKLFHDDCAPLGILLRIFVVSKVVAQASAAQSFCQHP